MRISLGGGTDLPSYYLDHGGFVIAAGIDKLLYVLIRQPFQKTIILKHSKLETVQDVDDIQHPIIREALKPIKPAHPHLEIGIADTGIDPLPIMTAAVEMLHCHRGMELIWASPESDATSSPSLATF
jgi:D-glycero-alpha-D-manno-heptose-7-phosphate kinase